ncbi:hypothetical protein EDC04DRAFT_3145904 [Pisolithus marmoratus]|nr:hypothetical protein EDC04DRAFT_3145904 [Pisolithus marmoratus]
MVLIDEEAVPPPAYYVSSLSAPPPFPTWIIYMTFPQTPNLERQRKTLYWLTYHLTRQPCILHRCDVVLRGLLMRVTAYMHTLNSTYLPASSSLGRSPSLSSDPFSMTSAISSAPLNTTQPDPSEPHLGGDEPFEDLFDVIQPQPSRGPRPPLWHA